MNYPTKVEQLKIAVDVSGKLLLDKSHTDQRIDQEITILMNIIDRSDEDIRKESDRIYSTLDYTMTVTEANIYIRSEFYKFIGITTQLDFNFWKNFGSAPLYQKYEDEKVKKGIGMDKLFDGKFDGWSNACDIEREISVLTENFKSKIDRDLERSAFINIVSPYKNLDDIQENVTVKKAKEAAKIFLMDNTKSIEDKLEVFDIYGEEEQYIYDPNHPFLNKIFEIYKEQDMIQKYEVVDCLDIVEWWIDELSDKRCEISYVSNKYHPNLIRTKRNYEPSQEALDRLSNYYRDIILEEGVVRFTFDW